MNDNQFDGLYERVTRVETPATTATIPPENAPATLPRPGAGHQEEPLMPGSAYKCCCRCGQSKPLDDFVIDRRLSTGRSGRCRECAREASRRWREKHRDYFRNWHRENRERNLVVQRRWREAQMQKDPEAYREDRRRAQKKSMYGLTLAEYDAIIARGCAICGTTERVGLDHCHDTGTNREGLCQPCNAGLGLYLEDPDRLRAAVEYLERHN